MPIIEDHPITKPLKENAILWKYMDIPSFLALLVNQSLTFVRADLMEDKYEGTIPKMTASIINKDAIERINSGNLSKEFLNFSKIMEGLRNTTYLNCWCKENHQMIHMWKIYSKENGIAIETNYKSLKESLETDEYIYPTEIQYIDFDADIINLQSNAFTVYTIKRKEYKSEHELRLMIHLPNLVEDQLYKPKKDEPILAHPKRNILYEETEVVKCKINPTKLISKIHISPFAPKWYHQLITKIVSDYGLNHISIVQSDL